jgi:AraC-like DNA-binding protein
MLQLRYRFLTQGYDIRTQKEHVSHPSPPFCRLFIFFKAGAEVIIMNKSYKLIPNSIWLIPPGNPFEVTYHQGSELLYYHVCVMDFAGSQLFGSKDVLLKLENPELIKLLQAAHRSHSTLLLRNLASTALSFMAEPYLPELQKKTLLAIRFRKLFEGLENEPPASLRVDGLAERMNLTPSALSKSFRRLMKIPLKKFLEQRTLEKAQELLLYSRMNIESISKSLGFIDAHYFYRYFQAKTGLTPSKYRYFSKK